MELRKKSKMARRAISMTNLSGGPHIPVHHPIKPKRPKFATVGSQTIPMFYMETAEMVRRTFCEKANANTAEKGLVDGEHAKQRMKEIFYSLSWINFSNSSTKSTSNQYSPVSPGPSSPDSVFGQQLTFPKRNIRLINGKRKMIRDSSLEEELGERLTYMSEIAKQWRQKCKIEREDNLRLCDHLYLCERKCQYLIDDMAQNYEDKILQLEEKVIRALEVQEKLIHEKSSFQEDSKYRMDRLETIKKQLEDKSMDLERQIGRMKDEIFRLKKDNLTQNSDMKKQKDEYEKTLRDAVQNSKMLEDKCLILDGKLKEAKEEINQIQEDNSLLETENRTYKKENDCLIHEIISKGRHMESKTRELVMEMGKLKDELTQLRERNVHIMKDNHCYKAENHRLLEEFSTIRNDFDNCESELVVARCELENVRDENQKIKHENLLNDAKEEEDSDFYGIILDIALNKLRTLERSSGPSSPNPNKGRFRLNVNPDNPLDMSMEEIAQKPQLLDESSVDNDAASVGSEFSNEPSSGTEEKREYNGNKPKRHRTFSDPLAAFEDAAYLDTVAKTYASKPIKRSASGSLLASTEKVKVRNKSLRRNVLSLSAGELKLMQSSLPSKTDLSINLSSSYPGANGSVIIGEGQPDTSPPKSKNIHTFTEASLNLNEKESPKARRNTVDTTYHEPFQRNLYRRSVSQRDLIRKNENGNCSPQRAISQGSLPGNTHNSSNEDLAGTRNSGFGVLRSRRNGIPDMPKDITKQLKSLKKSKSKDFGDIMRKLSRDHGELNKNMARKRSKSLKMV